MGLKNERLKILWRTNPSSDRENGFTFLDGWIIFTMPSFIERLVTHFVTKDSWQTGEPDNVSAIVWI